MGKNNIIDSTIKNNNKENNTNPEKVFDIAIIGGGFAGLSAALLLGRYIRPTVIFDSGNTRNSVTRQVIWVLKIFVPHNSLRKLGKM